MDRRRFVMRLLGAHAAGLLVPRWGGAEESPETPTGTPYPLVALPGKAPLGQIYDRPPNYETPTPKLIGTRSYPYTDSEYYYVRWREADVPRIAPYRFRLTVAGDRVRKPLTLSLDDLRRFPQVEIGAVGECAGLGTGLLRPRVSGVPWYKGDLSCAVWGGASLKAVLEAAGIQPGAVAIAFRAAGRTVAVKEPDYWRVYPPEVVLTPDSLLAWEMNGRPLPLWNGYPLRVVVPGSYAPAWVKQVVEIQVRSTPQPLAWSGDRIDTGTLKVYSLIVAPADGTRVPAGQPVTLTGLAWDSGHGITKVEVSIDGGRNWSAGALERSYGKYVWRVWRATVPTSRPGRLEILSRATSVTGESQPLEVPRAVLENGGKKNNAMRTFAALLEVV